MLSLEGHSWMFGTSKLLLLGHERNQTTSNSNVANWYNMIQHDTTWYNRLKIYLKCLQYVTTLFSCRAFLASHLLAPAKMTCINNDIKEVSLAKSPKVFSVSVSALKLKTNSASQQLIRTRRYIAWQLALSETSKCAKHKPGLDKSPSSLVGLLVPKTRLPSTHRSQSAIVYISKKTFLLGGGFQSSADSCKRQCQEAQIISWFSWVAGGWGKYWHKLDQLDRLKASWTSPHHNRHCVSSSGSDGNHTVPPPLLLA